MIHRPFKGKLLQVSTKNIRLPNGYRAEIDIVTHPGASLIVPFLNPSTVAILRQFRPVIGRYLFELPAGTLERGESPLACARREIIEEIGHSASKMIKIGEIFPVPGYSTEKITIFRAEKLTPVNHTLEKDEVLTLKRLSKAAIKQLFNRGQIQDAKTICALALCGWL